jgi:predicted 2-oxoglutarate/Fe(II)-dependent dioxygenase YbiX
MGVRGFKNMISADFLSRMGLFVIKKFLDPESCEALISAAPYADGKLATVTSEGQDIYDENARKTFQITLPKEMESAMYSRFMAIRPDLETHFHITLEDCRAPLLLLYGVGEFFGRHGDTNDDPNLPEIIKKRKVSVVIMLNEAKEQDEPNSYSGGALTFYELLPDPRLKSRGFPLQAEEGLLIAFPSRMIHEVQPVLRGHRYTIVTWFV